MSISSEVLNWKESIFKSPEIYIGNVVTDFTNIMLWDEKTKKICTQNTKINEGLLNILSEVIYNSFDQFNRKGKKLTYVDINISIKNNKILIHVKNDGPIIEIKKQTFTINNPESKNKVETFDAYIPEVLFGRMSTSTNYSKKEDNIKTSGKNGMGIKVVNVLSNSFIINISDGIKVFTKKYVDGMAISEPEIVVSKTKNSFVEVFCFLNSTMFDVSLVNTCINYVKKILIDSSFVLKNVKLSLNGEIFKSDSVEKLLSYYDIEPLHTLHFNHETLSTWFINIKSHTDTFISICNGSTQRHEGEDLKRAKKQCYKLIKDFCKSKLKLENVKQESLKHFMIVTVLNDANVCFDTQSKSKVTSLYPKVVYKLTPLQEKTITNMDFFKNWYIPTKVTKEHIREATKAGTKQWKKCTLFITEGRSAVGFVTSGLTVIKDGNDFNGVYPIKGKFLNINKATLQRKTDNTEINDLRNILGIEQHIDYTKENGKLRYGKVNILTDADDDGIHIKSLLLNFFFSFNESLFDIDFVESLNTPVIRVFEKKDKFVNYYSENEFKKIKVPRNYLVSYIKGLGSIKPGTIATYDVFIHPKINTFIRNADTRKSFIDNFSTGFEKERKNIILKSIDNCKSVNIEGRILCQDYLSYNLGSIFFVNVIKRHLPYIEDGLKQSQRKIIFTTLKKLKNGNLDERCENFAGAVSDLTNYHHGSVSLEKGILNMAQDHVGSNNEPYFVGDGNVGTRTTQAAASRYYRLNYNNFFDKYFKIEPELMTFNYDENKQTEPKTFHPLIPYFLINGIKGVCPGFKTDIFPYNIQDLLKLCKQIILGEPTKEPIPYFKGFKGKISKTTNGVKITGIMEQKGNIFTITEFPPTVSFDIFFDKVKGLFPNLADLSNDNGIKIQFKSELSYDDVYKMVGIEKTHKLSNYYIIKNDKPTKYDSIVDILKDSLELHKQYLDKKKALKISILDKDIKQLNDKIEFIKLIKDKTVDLLNDSEQTILEKINIMLKTKDQKYPYLTNLRVIDINKMQGKELTNKIDELNNMRNFKLKESIETMFLNEL
uniref:DNA topoisomerase (ATP-hydrolyzing) n=1 Tax=viral metagenome TaxID=1070528 RepID=A0A6C0JAQ5_9ZZZZ